MTLSQLIETIPDFGRDTRLNLDSILKSPEIPGLTETQRASIALACAYTVENQQLIQALDAEYTHLLTPEIRKAAQGAATLMAMNNVYYRFLHLAEDTELKKLPAKLRMNLIGKPGIDKVDFELICLAVSALAGCGSCIQAHIQEVKKAGVSIEGIQSSSRIAAVINAAARALKMTAVLG
jgi:alkyl hydroperoxide reductase subunit D